MTDVVIVESPAKAKTINKYLGSKYTVLASYGHIRDLAEKDGSVRPDANFEVDWKINPQSQKHLKEIAEAVKNADHLYLATDPDREGEGIAWHLQEFLTEKSLLSNVSVKRVVFNEVTQKAVLDAFERPRDVDRELVEAYLARRVLDRLMGYELSKVLRHKLPRSKSAGRVQSPALRLICERETEIEQFVPQEYWSVKVNLKNAAGEVILARLSHLNGEKLAKLALGNEEAASHAVQAIETQEFSVSRIEPKQTRKHPNAPFTTSTLQQEAARKLYFSAKRTMQIAQRLYEGLNVNGETVGLITYMRTDGVSMAQEAINACRNHISDSYGNNYLPPSPRVYKAKAKNAQEAHEAIRPTDIARRPQDMGLLETDQRRLCQLIWNRSVASQMESALINQVAIDLRPVGRPQTDNHVTLRATGSVIAFEGYLRLYQEGKDDGKDEEKEGILPDVKVGEMLSRTSIKPEQHFTQPPARFSEASLVKRLEELGIGRPSTYAPTLSKLQDNNYVRLEKRRFYPEDRARLVTAFLSSFFTQYVEYDVTAELEEKWDDISGGRIDWKSVLHDFWKSLNEAIDGTSDLRIREVLDTLNDLLGPHFFRANEEGGDPRKCPNCEDGQLSLKLGRHGAFIGCSNYPDCKHTRPLAVPNGDKTTDSITDNGPKDLGTDFATGLSVTLRRGPYGFYIQLGEPEGKEKPKRAALTADLNPSDIDLKTALGLLALPRGIGLHPTEQEMITAAIGRFGAYIKMGGTYVSLKEDNVLEIGLNRAVDLLADAPRRPAPVEIGVHPKDKKPITLRQGRYGPYVQHNTIRATLPKDKREETPSLEIAIDLIDAKAARKKTTTKKKAASKKRTNKKMAAMVTTQD